MRNKKASQLGMNPSTASHRLVKDILWKLLCDSNLDTCFKCGEKMSRDTFSIEHIIPWMDSDDPLGLYFSLDNISFSHLRCNIASAKKFIQTNHGTSAMYRKGCRCEECKEYQRLKYARYYSSDKRNKRYKKFGY